MEITKFTVTISKTTPGYQTFMFRRPYLPPGSELTYEKQKNRKKPSWFEVSFTIWESNESAK
jgi:hypothetical protein